MDGNIGTGETMIVIYKNGSEYKRGWNANGVSWMTGWGSMSVASLCLANGTGDYFQIYVQQGSGGSMGITRGGNLSWFNGSMMRGL